MRIKRSTVRAVGTIIITLVLGLSLGAMVATFLGSNVLAAERTTNTWYNAKKNTLITNLIKETYFCKCPLTITDGRVSVNYAHCGFKPDSVDTGNRVMSHYDHIFPAKLLGGHLACWDNRTSHPGCLAGDSGARCCYRTNPDFRVAYTDIVNLAQVVDRVNMSKGDSVVADIPGHTPRYGMCDVEIDTDKFEPPESLKGDVARVYQYMYVTYGDRLGIMPEPELAKWMLLYDFLDPIDVKEIERNRNITETQGYGNPKIFFNGAVK